MHKAILAISFTILGGAAAAFVGVLQAQPERFIAGPEPIAVSVPVRAYDLRSSIGFEEPVLPALPEARPMGSVQPSSVQAKKATELPEPEVLPCSAWRDIGPKSVQVKGLSESHRVRELCLVPPSR